MTADEAPGVATSLEGPERIISVRGVSTHLFEAGATSAPPLLYLHGTFLGNLWVDFHLSLAQQFHVFAPDIPGFGLSERPELMRDMSDYVLYLRDLLDTLGLEKAALVGHSLGGWMAAEMAVWYPERFEKLVLSNAAGIRVKGSPTADIFAMNARELVMTCFDDFAAAAPLMPAELNVDYLIGQYRQLTTLASLAWNPSYDPKLERRLQRIACPTLIVWGEHDRLIPPVYAEAFHRAIPGSEVIMLSGTGHMPMFEQTQEWSKAVTDFLCK